MSDRLTNELMDIGESAGTPWKDLTIADTHLYRDFTAITRRDWTRVLGQLAATMQRLKESDDALASSADWSAQLKADNDRLVEREAKLKDSLVRITHAPTAYTARMIAEEALKQTHTSSARVNSRCAQKAQRSAPP